MNSLKIIKLTSVVKLRVAEAINFVHLTYEECVCWIPELPLLSWIQIYNPWHKYEIITQLHHKTARHLEVHMVAFLLTRICLAVIIIFLKQFLSSGSEK